MLGLVKWCTLRGVRQLWGSFRSKMSFLGQYDRCFRFLILWLFPTSSASVRWAYLLISQFISMRLPGVFCMERKGPSFPVEPVTLVTKHLSPVSVVPGITLAQETFLAGNDGHSRSMPCKWGTCSFVTSKMIKAGLRKWAEWREEQDRQLEERDLATIEEDEDEDSRIAV